MLSSGTTVAPTLTGLTPGTTYTYCYTFTVSSNCTSHTAHYPYFIGTITVLPIELGSYSAFNSSGNTNKIEWTTESERDNAFFTLEHSTDGLTWKQLVKYPGAGNSSVATSYNISHKDVESVYNYYRLSQTDFDGTKKTFHPLLVDNTQSTIVVKTVNIYGQEVPDSYRGLVIEYYSDGSTVKRIR